MMVTRADQVVLGYLGRALSLELSAVQLYSTQAQLVASWGLAEPAKRLHAEASEEMTHADRIIARMLALGVAPNASQLRPVVLGKSLHELLRYNHAFEQELVRHYAEAARYCARTGDHDDRLFFETLLAEEQAHGQEMAEWLAQLEQPAIHVNSVKGATF
jgi:bacterioferritin